MKSLIDVLRDEGIRSKNGEAAAVTIAKSLQDSFELYLDSIVTTNDHALALAKALSTAFVIRSGHFAVLKRMPSVHVVAVHRDCMGWLFGKLQTSVNLPNKKRRNKVAGLWKCMVPMLSTAEPREALQIKKQLDNVIKQSKVEITEGKLWEPLRAYEKRLMYIMAKDKAIGDAAKTATRKATQSANQPASDPIAEQDDGPTPIRAQPRPRPVRKEIVPPADDLGEVDLGLSQEDNGLLLPAAEINGMSTPLGNGNESRHTLSNGKKRAREEEDEESLNLDLDASEDDEEQNDPIGNGIVATSEPTGPPNAMKRRRR